MQNHKSSNIGNSRQFENQIKKIPFYLQHIKHSHPMHTHTPLSANARTFSAHREKPELIPGNRRPGWNWVYFLRSKIHSPWPEDSNMVTIPRTKDASEIAKSCRLSSTRRPLCKMDAGSKMAVVSRRFLLGGGFCYCVNVDWIGPL